MQVPIIPYFRSKEKIFKNSRNFVCPHIFEMIEKIVKYTYLWKLLLIYFTEYFSFSAPEVKTKLHSELHTDLYIEKYSCN